MKLTKLTKAQKNMIEVISRACSSFLTTDGYCENYDITRGHTVKERVLNQLIDMKVVTRWHSKQKSRRFGGHGVSHSNNGFVLYKLAPLGIKYMFDKIMAEEKANHLTLRVAKRMQELKIKDTDLGAVEDSTDEMNAVVNILSEIEAS